MTKVIGWLVGGFVLLGLSGMLEAIGDMGASPGARLMLYLPALAALLGAPFCFYKAFRSALSAARGGEKRKASEPEPSPGPARPARRLADPVEEESFDPDAAFARYMERRSAASPPQEPGPSAAAAAPVRTGFGRKGL